MSYNKETKMYEGYIYLITNNINNRIYIGQTTTTVYTRWKDHKCASKNNIKYTTPLYTDIRKFGINHFEYRQIEKYENISLEGLKRILNEKEKYYIKFYHSSIDFGGYNTENGGTHVEKKVFQYDLELNLLNTFDNLVKASIQTGIEKGTIRHVCAHDRLSTHGFIFCYDGDNPILPKSRQIRGVKYIYNMKDIYGNVINSFNSISEINSYLNLKNCKSGLLSAIKDNRRYHNYYWEQIVISD